MIILWLIVSFLFGLAGGSFLNCLIWRLYEKKSLKGRSICPKCGHQLTWQDNIPVVSFILLKGRCRYCGEKISLWYPIIELTTGIFFALVVLKNFGFFYSFKITEAFTSVSNSQNEFLVLQIIRDWIGVFVLLFIFIYDLKYRIIEDIVLLPATFGVFFINLLLGWSWQRMALGMLIAIVFFGSQYILTKRKGIGLGDMRIGIFLSAFFGEPWIFLIALFLGYIIGAIVGIILIVCGKKKWRSQVPLGPFLSLGAFLVLFFG